ncbi:bifunctional diguanylate cyclase/phosphodiesterase, partial [Thermodesulfatator autotrophicus]|uniref:bifunctional diguanylate cyclase/phosphodiesterase n=1 Tax=Thermodesulfatator autotrophicus TaxID=1795632 RepID=UPI0012FB25E9
TQLLKYYLKISLDSHIKDKAFTFLEAFFEDVFKPGFYEKILDLSSKHLKAGITPAILMSLCESLKMKIIQELRNLKSFDDKDFCTVSRFFALLATYFFQAYYNLLFERLTKNLEQLSRKNRFLSLIREINLLIFPENISEKELFEKACHILVKEGGYSLAWIGLIENDQIIFKGAFPEDHPYLKHLPKELEEFMGTDLRKYAKDFLAGHPVIINDINQDEAYKVRRDKIKPYNLNSIAIVPLFLNEKIAGGVFLYHSQANFFASDEIKLLHEVGRDISIGLRHIRQQERLEKALFKDDLTGLPNEKALVIELASLAIEATKDDFSVAIIRTDIIDFSAINQSLGYTAGDKILKELARRLKELLKNKKGIIARTGPDEFSIAYLFEDLSHLKSFLSSLKEIMRKPFWINQSELRLEIGLGVAVYPKQGNDIIDVYEKAAVALKNVFRQKGGGTAFYSPEHSLDILKKFSLLGELERAIKQKELLLFYQPRINLQTREVVGFEALLRWKHPDRGIIPPLEFIPILEESHLILEVEPLIWEIIAKFWGRIREKFPHLKVSVNISASQLKEKRFVEKLKDYLKTYEISKEAIELEITESLLLDPVAERNVKNLCAEGFSLALDDFGTGYSSFQYLKNLRGMDIKIDRSFIAKVPDDREQVSLVMAMVSMARGLNLRTVAEGIERREQLAFITGLGVDEVQGFYFSRPLPWQNALNFLESYNPREFFW